MQYPSHLLQVIEVLKKLPGVGGKSAERFAFHMLSWKPEQLEKMATTIQSIPEKLITCSYCGCLSGKESCPFCQDERVKCRVMCIVSSPKDAFAVEKTGEFKGIYHVLGALLSPMQGIGPEELHLQKLIKRIQELSIKEVIIALDSTLEGDTTALYLKQELSQCNLELTLTRLALGLPIGSALDYVDGGTLARAFSGRKDF